MHPRAKKQPEEDRKRELRRAKAAPLWDFPLAGPATNKVRERTKQWTAMRIAAFLLDGSQPTEMKDKELADWLLCARPEFAQEVATGVAAIALREGRPEVWDALAAVSAMDMNKAIEIFDADGPIAWTPEAEWLATDA